MDGIELNYRISLLQEATVEGKVENPNIGVINKIYNKDHDAQVTISKYNGKTYLSFRSLNSLIGAEQCAHVLPAKFVFGMTTKGFEEYYSSVATELNSFLRTINTDPLVVVGHSLGAISGVLFAEDWISRGGSIEELWIMGYPAGTSTNVLFRLEDKISTITSVINGNDVMRFIIPFVPRFPTVQIGKYLWWKPFSFRNHFLQSFIGSQGYYASLREYYKVDNATPILFP